MQLELFLTCAFAITPENECRHAKKNAITASCLRMLSQPLTNRPKGFEALLRTSWTTPAIEPSGTLLDSTDDCHRFALFRFVSSSVVNPSLFTLLLAYLQRSVLQAGSFKTNLGLVEIN